MNKRLIINRICVAILIGLFIAYTAFYGDLYLSLQPYL